MKIRAGWALSALLWLAPAGLCAGSPETWVPARWDGGPLEVFHRAKDKSLSDPAVRQAISDWYNPDTLKLLDESPINCLLLTFSTGADPELEKKQQALVKEYARLAHERSFAVLGMVYPGANAFDVAAAASDAKLDGLVVDGKFPDGLGFAGRLEEALRSNKSTAIVIPVGTPELLRKSAAPVVAVRGVAPQVREAGDTATASATGGLWIESNMWLVRSFHGASNKRPVWIIRDPAPSLPHMYVLSIADAAAVGGRWVVALDDDFRSRLLRRDADALGAWRGTAAPLRFYEAHAEWRDFTPYGTVGIILDPAGPNLGHTEECLNLVARRQIAYRVLERPQLSASALEGLRAVLAFDLAPPTDAERKALRSYAEAGGLVLGGPAWGTPPKDQSYTIEAAGEGEVAVYKDAAPDPASVARDLNDLVPTPELGVSVFNAPSVLSYVSMSRTGRRMLIQMVHYAKPPAEPLTIWVTEKFSTAHFYPSEGPPVDLAVRRSGSRTEIVVPQLLNHYGALLLE